MAPYVGTPHYYYHPTGPRLPHVGPPWQEWVVQNAPERLPLGPDVPRCEIVRPELPTVPRSQVLSTAPAGAAPALADRRPPLEIDLYRLHGRPPSRKRGLPRYLMVITDRLSKYVQLEAMSGMGAEECALRFRDVWWRFHGFPSQIITDRGSNWLSKFWTTLCEAVGIEQLLSTAHHPQTDGGTERVN